MNDIAPISQLERIECEFLNLPQVECPVTNVFVPGIYWRELFIPAGSIAIGHEHRTEHINVLLSGTIRVMVDGKQEELTAPLVFKSEAGVRKAVYAVTDVRYVNVHANEDNETNMDKLEEKFIKKSASFLRHQEEVKQLLQNQTT